MNFLKEGLLILLCIAMHVGGGLLDDSDTTLAFPEKNEERNEPFQGFNNDEYGSEKSDTDSKGHSFTYFGKRSPGQKKVSDLLQYLQRNQEPSWKRGHSIMRFGKRSGDKHNFLRIGKRSSGVDYDFHDITRPEEKKVAHSMMYFGKRDSPVGQKKTGHSMMYFGKRQYGEDIADDKRTGHSMMHIGKRDSYSYIEPDELEKKAGHSMMYFGKRDGEDDFDKRSGHSMMYFGKRDDDDDFDKRSGHSMMYFGKRDDDDDFSKRSGHSMMYFGKRSNGEDSPNRAGHSMMYFGKRSNGVDSANRAGHSMMYFGKRDLNAENDTEKRAGHSMMYFGKRDENPSDRKAGHSMMYFGKRLSNSVEDETEKRRGHSMMYFGKRQSYDDTLDGEEKRTGHSMMYFGKRVPFEDYNESSEIEALTRPDEEKRAKHHMMYFGKKSDGAHSMMHFDKSENEGENYNERMEKKATPSMNRFGMRQFYRLSQDPSSWLPASGPLGPVDSRYINLFSSNPERRQVYDKKKHNMMHFGKRSVSDLYTDAISANDESQMIHRANSTVSKAEISKATPTTRNKRETNESEDLSLLPVTSYASHYPEVERNENGDLYIVEEDQVPKNLVIRRRSVDEPQNTKNVFMRFG